MSEGKRGGPEVPHIFTETRYEKFQNHYYRFLKVLFVAWNVAYLDHEDIITAAERIPQMVAAKMNHAEAKQTAEGLMTKYQEKIDQGEPLPVDLATLYLQQEHEIAGVSTEDMVQAKAKFDALAETTKRQQADHWSVDETLGWILKQQGDYNDANNLLTDLLLTGQGECEARAKFIEALVQATFPEYVGKMKVEFFRGQVNDDGTIEPGHTRVVLDLTAEGKGIVVLEGDAPHHETSAKDIAKHQKIAMYEATGTAVKSIAVKEGITTWAKERAAHKPELQQAARADAKKAKNIDRVAKLAYDLHEALADDTINANPPATAHYTDGRAHMDVSPKKVVGSYAHSAEDFKDAIELTITHNSAKPTMTLANMDLAFTTKPGFVDLAAFSTYDSQALEAILAKRRARAPAPGERGQKSTDPVVINSQLGILTKSFKKYGPIAWDLQSQDLPPIQDIPTSSIEMDIETQISNGLADIAWDKDSRLVVRIKSGQGVNEEIAGGQNLNEAIKRGLSAITIMGDLSGDYSLSDLNLRNSKLKSLNLVGVDVGDLSGLTVDNLDWTKTMGFKGGSLANVRAHRASLYFGINSAEQPGLRLKNALDFDGSIFFSAGMNGRGVDDHFEVDILRLNADMDQRVVIQPGSFSGMRFNTLAIDSDILLEGNALENANIGTLIIDPGETAPSDMMASPVAATGHIDRVVIIKRQEVLLNRQGTDDLNKAVQHGGDKSVIALTMDDVELGMFKENSKLTAPIYVVGDQLWQSLIEKYGEEQLIPDDVLASKAYLINRD